MEPQRQLALIAATLLVAAACAQTWSWGKACASVEDFEADRAACIEESGDTSGIMHFTTKRFVERCLARRGWQKTPVDEPLACEREPVVEAPAPIPAPRPATDEPSGLSFDDCFSRCRELTDRSKEECFDVCLVR